MAPSPSWLVRSTLPSSSSFLLLLTFFLIHILLLLIPPPVLSAHIDFPTDPSSPFSRSSPSSSSSSSSHPSAPSSPSSAYLPPTKDDLWSTSNTSERQTTDDAPHVTSAVYSNRRATVVGGLRVSDGVSTYSAQFIDVTFSEPLYARVDDIFCLSTYASRCDCNVTAPDSLCDPSQHTCIDLGDEPVRITSEIATFTYFSINIPPCRSALIYIRPISGDPDLYLSQSNLFPNLADYTWVSYNGSNLTPEWFIFCCGQPLYSSGSRVYAGVYSFTRTTYDFYVKDVTEPLPITDFFPFSNMHLQCNGSDTEELYCQTRVPESSDVSSCPISQAFPAINTDYSRFSVDSNPLMPPDFEFEAISGLYLAYQLTSQTSFRGGTTSLSSYNMTQCTGTFTNLYSLSGKKLVDTFRFTPFEPPCVEAEFKQVAERINQLGTLYNNATSYDDFRKIQGATLTYTTGDAWYACMRLANQFLHVGSMPVMRSTTRCTAAFGTANYSQDPCCSSRATFNSTCVEQNKSYSIRSYTVNKDLVADTCSEIPGCIYLSLSDYALFRQREDSPSSSCASITQKAIEELGSVPQLTLDYDCMGIATGTSCFGTSVSDCGHTTSFCSIFHRCSRSCFVDSDCPYNQTCQWGYCETPYENAKQIDVTTQCMTDTMDTSLREYLLASWNLSSTVPNPIFNSTFRSTFARDKCRGGPEIDNYMEREMASICLNISSCNWGPCSVFPLDSDRSRCENACLNKRPPFGPSTENHFCGVCQNENPESCFEISEWTGCYVRDPDMYRLGCETLGAFSNDIEYECIFNSTAKPTITSCLDPFFCPYTRIERGLYGSVRTVCAGYCYDPTWLNETACYEECPYDTCWWTGTVCMVKDYTTAPTCLNAGASWWAEHVWKNGSLQSQSECETGYCYPHLGLDQAACESKAYCTAPCPANADGECTNATECAASGFCSDRELTHPDPTVDGVCVYSYKLSSSGLPSCPLYTIQGRTGCIDYTITDESDCLSLNHTSAKWLRPASTRAECEAHGIGCREDKYTFRYSYIGSPGQYFLSPKNNADCTAAGGTPEPYYTWYSGSWVSGGQWKALYWKQRQWLPLNQRIVSDFSFENWYFNEYPQAFAKLYFPIIKSDQYCRYNRIIDILSKISCSCVAQPELRFESDVPCALEPKIMVGVATLCTGFDYQLEAIPTGRLYIDKNVVISPPCVEGRVFSLSATQLQRNDPSYFFSDIYVRTLAITPTNYSIIENAHKVVVAQLIGDGAQFQFYDTSTGEPRGVISDPYKGNITLCLFKRPDIMLESKFRKFGFAVASADLNQFSIMTDWTVWTKTEGTDFLICGTLSYPLPAEDRPAVFPIYRADDGWEDETFYSSQPIETVFFFFFAVGLYGLVLLANTIITGLLMFDYKTDIVRIWESLSDNRWKKAWRTFYDFFDMPRLIHMLIEVITIDRIIYFSLLPTGILNDKPSVVYIILGELPIYLFFSIYTALVSFWVELVHFRFGLKRSQASTVKRIKLIFLGVNIFMYSFLITLIIVFSILEHYAPSSMTTCEDSAFLDGGSSSEYETARKVLFILYQCVVVVMALVISFGFLVYGTRLVILLYRTEAVNSKFSKLRRSKTVKFITVMLVCTGALIALCAFLLYSAASETVEPVSAIVFIILAEILPLALLTFSVGKSVPNLLSFCGRLDRDPTSGSSSSKKEDSASNGQLPSRRVDEGDADIHTEETSTDDVDQDSCDSEEEDDSNNNHESGDARTSSGDIEMRPTRTAPRGESPEESDEVRLSQ